MTETTTPLFDTPTPVNHWVYIDGDNLVDVTYSNFVLDGVAYSQVDLQQPEAEVKALGLYKLINSPPSTGDFQHAVLKPDLQWERDHEAKNITMTYDVYDHQWRDVRNIIVSRAKNDLETMARARGYESILETVSYTSSSNETYRTEALHCLQLRDQVWTILEDYLGRVDLAQEPQPTSHAQVMALLPTIAWPA
jgi:uncharacterized protein (UPF0297 family)